MVNNISIYTKNEDETIRLGKKIGKLIKGKYRTDKNLLYTIYLIGELGTGKTVFVKGLAEGLGVKNSDNVCSPTFVLVHRYNGEITLYHIDLYRLKNQLEINDILYNEIEPNNAVITVEWADKIKWLEAQSLENKNLNRLGSDSQLTIDNIISSCRQIRIEFEHIDQTTRKITVS